MTATVPESKLVAAYDRETPWLESEPGGPPLVLAADLRRRLIDLAADLRRRLIDLARHSHPDAPAVPSATDAESAWEGWAYLIVSVVRSRSCEIRSWRFRSPFFTEQSIEEIPHHV